MAKVIKLTTIGEQSAKEFIRESVMNRMNPSTADGLRDGNRAIFYALLNDYKDSNKAGVKARLLCSTVADSYHLHKEDSIYRSAFLMTRERLPLISRVSTRRNKSGVITTDKYVEFKLTEWGEFLGKGTHFSPRIKTHDLSKEIVEFYGSLFPYWAFTNYSNLAKGLNASTISLCPEEIFKAMLILLEDLNTTTDRLMDVIKGVDVGRNYTALCHPQSIKTLLDEGYGKFTILTNINITREYIDILDTPYKTAYVTLTKRFSSAIEEDTFKSFKVETVVNSTDMDIVLRIKYRLKPGYTVGDVMKELYSLPMLMKTVSIEYIGLRPSTDGFKDKNLDIMGLKEYLINCLKYGYNNRIRDLQIQLEKLQEKINLNSLLEKLTRPEVEPWFGPMVQEKKSNEAKIQELFKLGNERIKDFQFSEYITIKGGLTIEECNTTFARLGNNVLGQLGERNKVLSELSRIDWELKQIHDQLKPENVKQHLRETLEDWLKKPECARQTPIKYQDVDTVIETKSQITERVLRTRMMEADKLKNQQVNLIFYNNGTCNYYNPKESPNIPKEMMNNSIFKIIKCTTHDKILIFNSYQRTKILVGDLIDNLDNYNKATLRPGIVFQGVDMYDWDREGFANEDGVTLIITSGGRAKKMPTKYLIQRSQCVRDIAMNAGERILYLQHFSSEDEANRYTAEIMTAKGLKRKNLSEMHMRGLDGFNTLLAPKFFEETIDARLCQNELTINVINKEEVSNVELALSRLHKRDTFRETPIIQDMKHGFYMDNKEYYRLDGENISLSEVFGDRISHIENKDTTTTVVSADTIQDILPIAYIESGLRKALDNETTLSLKEEVVE